MSFTIAHLTDAHLAPAPWPRLSEMHLKRLMGYVNWKRGRERQSDMAALDRLVDDMRAQTPDHIAVTGDLVNIALPAEFRRAGAWIRKLGDPADVSFTPGNHDAYVSDALKGLAETFAPWTKGDDAYQRGQPFPFVRVRHEVALIGLSSAVPTAPLMATGRLGARQLAALAEILQETGAKGLARVILIHHPPLLRDAPLRGLTDARGFEATVGRFGAEAILHGHTHKRMTHHLVSPATRIEGGRVPVIGAPSVSSAAASPRQRAAYHLIRLERAGDGWRVEARARGLLPRSAAIGEREAPAV